MRLLIDARFTRTDHHDGISRYGASLIEAVATRTETAMLVNDERQLALLPDVPHVKVSSPLSPSELFIAARVNGLVPDVVFCPMQTMGTWGRRYPLILTLHDLIYYEHPEPPAGTGPDHVSLGAVNAGCVASATPLPSFAVAPPA